MYPNCLTKLRLVYCRVITDVGIIASGKDSIRALEVPTRGSLMARLPRALSVVRFERTILDRSLPDGLRLRTA